MARDPRRWRSEAEGLLMACRLLFDHWERAERAYPAGYVALPALLLGGYAVEDYAKARLVELGISWEGKRGHDLPWLVAAAGVSLDESDTALLFRLSEVVQWAGRYPAPLERQPAEWGRFASTTDLPVIERMCERLLNCADKPR
jgi:hypothetical protein